MLSFTSTVSFLGFIFEAGQVRTYPEKTKVVVEWPTPQVCKQLQRFLRFSNFYRGFIKTYSQVATPLTQLTSSVHKFIWSSEVEDVFQEFKRLFSSAPILSHPEPLRQFIVEVDASDTSMGAVLSQMSLKMIRCTLAPFSLSDFPPLKEIMMWGIMSYWPSRWPWKNGDIECRELNYHL